MALLRSIEHFIPYIERLGQYFEANRIVGEQNSAKRRSTFLSVVGPGQYKLLRSILALVKPSEKTFRANRDAKSHYNPPPSEVMQHGNRYRGIYVYYVYNFGGHLQENLTYVLGS